MPDEDLRRICEFADQVRLSPGEVLFRDGDAGDAAYVICSGEVEVVKSSAGREVLLAVRRPGEVIGELALLEEQPRMATVRSARGAELLAIPREGFKRLLASSITAVQSLYFTMVERLRGTETMLRQSEKMAQLGTLSAGVAHELNNPAAAVRRGADQLSQEIARHTAAVKEVASLPLGEAATGALDKEIALAAGPPAAAPEGGALDRSDRESEIEDWLAANGVPDPWELAPGLAELGVVPARLEALSAAVGAPALGPAIRLLVSTHAVSSLLMEVSEGARRISEIVRSMKSYTYLDQAPVQDVDVHEGLESTLVIMRSKLKTGVEVRREYASGLPRITAYGSELNQVWTNIIDNALDAMAGRGTLTLRTRAEDGRIVVELEDDGPGIPPEIQGRVFDPFFTTKAPGKGTGLGLEISYRIVVDRHRGDIKVFSRPGRTTFRVTLPVTQDAGSAVPIAGGPRASDEDMKRLLQDARTIAVVGISTDPSKPAHEVPAYLATQGYDIIPINPKVDSVLERKAYADLANAPPGIDVVQVFRRPEAVPAVVGEAIAAGAKGVWMQPGVVNEEAAETARRAGLKVVMDACMMAEHRRLIGERK